MIPGSKSTKGHKKLVRDCKSCKKRNDKVFCIKANKNVKCSEINGNIPCNGWERGK